MFDEEFISNPLRDAVNTVETGKPSVKRTLGMEIFEHFSANPKDGDIFNKAMEQLSQENMQSIIDCYDFSCCNTIADLGGGYGNLLKGILAKYPEKKGVCFDFSHVIESLPEEMALQPNLRFEGGSLFDKVPENADTYILKHVIHGFNDELCLQILRNCKKVMDHNSRLLIIDVIAEPNEKHSYTHFIDFIDFIMLMFTGGRERTKAQTAALLEQVGLKINDVFDSSKKDKIFEVVVI